MPTSTNDRIRLVVLDISYNDPLGPIPKSLEALQYLKYFSVSFNDLTGEIPPDSAFKCFTSQSILSNKGLCGDPKFHISVCDTNPSSKSRTKKLLQIIFIFTATAIVMLGLVLIIVIRRYPRKDESVSNQLNLSARTTTDFIL